MKNLKVKGQVSPMGIVTIAVVIMIGVVVISNMYSSTYAGLAATTSTPNIVLTTVNSTFTTSGQGLNLMTVGIIVAAAVFILLLMGGAGKD